MTRQYRVISTHLFRFMARREMVNLEHLQAQAVLGSSASIALRELGVPAGAKFRISPHRWRAYWRVEAII